MSGGIRKLAAAFRSTPLHPQWFAFLRARKNLEQTCADLRGLVLDVGCADSLPREHLPTEATYIGLDYYSTATDWYGTRPDIFGDAQSLPIHDASVDHVLLLDVLEHIPEPDHCLSELQRVLKPGGSLTVQVPFLYPVHDAPLDFHRWTRFGLERAADRHGFRITSEKAIGHPLETAALNLNIAMSQTALNWVRGKNPLAILVVVLPVLVIASNTFAWLLASFSRSDQLMPYSYRSTWTRN
jgi:SAM-dependent methyltransferase